MSEVKQRKALKNIGKYRTEQQALESVKYSPSYAKSGLIKRTKSWQNLIQKYLPDNKLLKVHQEGLEATKQQGVGGMAIGLKNGEVESMGHTDINIPDYPTRHKYLETAYKIKGKFPKENSVGVAVQFNFKEDKEKYAI